MTDEVLPAGERGELVLTSLTKVAMPVVRYRTRALTRLLPGTARPMRRIEKVTGRTDDLIIVRGANVYPQPGRPRGRAEPGRAPYRGVSPVGGEGAVMQVADVLRDGFERVAEVVRAVTSGADTGELEWRSQAEGNSIAWLVWHLTRIQDDHVADAFGYEQVWLSDGWDHRFDLPLDRRDTGYGHSTDEVAAVRVTSPALLTGYFEAVHERTLDLLKGVGPDDLDRIVDTSWDPPVSLGVRLVSVLADDLQHAGQAAFVRGLHERTHR